VSDSLPLSEAPRRPVEGDGVVLAPDKPAVAPPPLPPRKPEVVSPDRAAANDDRQSVGLLLQALQRRPSRRPYVLATLASLLWLGAVAGFVATQIDGGFRALLGSLAPVQILVGAVALFGPVVLFYVAAMLAVRSMEMKLVARAVGEMAVRLAQPEAFSTDAIVSVSQAVRREVAAVGDGIERALARAGELETLVRSELSTLERAYSDNEIRIRSLVDELVAQRESIVTNADRVRSAITGSHQNLSHSDGRATAWSRTWPTAASGSSTASPERGTASGSRSRRPGSG
jgi:hypothetical protein